MSESRKMPGAEGVVILPRAVVEQALNALTSHCAFYSEYGSQKACFTAIAALRDSLAAPQPAPPETVATPFTYIIQHLNSQTYNLTKDECINFIKELRDRYAAAQEKT